MAKAGIEGTWRIVEMDLWDPDALDLVAPARIELRRDRTGSLTFIAVEATLDVRYSVSDGTSSAEFSWDGFDEGDPVSGRGRASLYPDGTLRGHLYFHMGGDSGFVANRTGRG